MSDEISEFMFEPRPGTVEERSADALEFIAYSLGGIHAQLITLTNQAKRVAAAAGP